MKKYAVIVAGGHGARMGTEIPKQFLLLRGKSILQHTVSAFLNAYHDLHVILVLPQEHGEEMIAGMGAGDRVVITPGGITRFHSVKKGLAHVTGPSVVFVHDGVRCLVTETLIKRCYEQAIEKGSAIPAIAATDSVRIEDEKHHRSIDRSKVRIIQTPQTFLSSILLPAYQQEFNDSFTDEATVVEASGEKVFLVEGEHSNIKITRPIDLFIAEKLLEEREKVGS